jgi:hypothetical protein
MTNITPRRWLAIASDGRRAISPLQAKYYFFQRKQALSSTAEAGSWLMTTAEQY